MNKPPEEIIEYFTHLLEHIKVVLNTTTTSTDDRDAILVSTLSIGPWVLDAYNKMKRAKEKTYRAYMYHLQHCKDKHAGVEMPDLEQK